MKIYTKSGDTGQTGLLGGDRTEKTSTRIEAIGAIDELNAYAGICCQHLSDQSDLAKVERIQNQLFDIGSELACPEGGKFQLESVFQRDIEELENEIDDMESELPALKEFILPGGTSAAAHLHYFRTVCRRAERQLLLLHAINPIRSEPIIYMNRLSDWIFCFSRLQNHRSGVVERKWTKREKE